jgi:hypothetical protein
MDDDFDGALMQEQVWNTDIDGWNMLGCSNPCIATHRALSKRLSVC